jgi:hypothetical protein
VGWSHVNLAFSKWEDSKPVVVEDSSDAQVSGMEYRMPVVIIIIIIII